jgi:phosphoribosylformimino-5-aminoimidazole carboxamide ribotide isomerase
LCALNLKVIPVIDILGGIVVHAIKGKRREYKPLQSNLSKSVDPLEVAKAFKTIGFSELYIADLDAIMGTATVNFQVFKRVVEKTKLKLMVDAGVTELGTAKKLVSCGVSRVVIGTETMPSMSFVDEAVKLFGNDHVIVSIDMKGNKVLAKLKFDGCLDPISLVIKFKEMGVSNIIVLDLARVGSVEGVDVDFLKKVIEEVSIRVYVGGGVRDVRDLFELKDMGVSGVLVATALHSGKISVEELKTAELI